MADVEAAIVELGLDDRAADRLRAMHPTDAQELLESIGPGLKNPSAYITKAANDRAHGKGKGFAPNGDKGRMPGRQPMPMMRRVEDEIYALGLDDRASEVLTSMDPAQALELLDSIPGNIRNISAYITKAVNDRNHGKGPPLSRRVERNEEPYGKGSPLSGRGAKGPPPSFGRYDPPPSFRRYDPLAGRVESAIASFGLDDKASNVVRNMDVAQAAELLDTIPPNVRNVSAYITKAVNDRNHGRGPPPGRKVEQAIASLALDERAATTLRNMEPMMAADLLDSMPPGVRNASAYITKAVNDRMHQFSPGAFVSMSPPMHAMPYGKGFMSQPVPMYPVATPVLPMRRPREDAQNASAVEARIEELQLDEKASKLLRNLPPMDAIGLIESMNSEVRNPSAFITKAANDRLKGTVDVESHRWRQVTALAEELRLDERAKNVVMELPSMEAYRVLLNCREKADSVNNPSAYVLKGVAAVQREMDPYSKRRRIA